ncbi:hypothetical protein [Fulvivirga ligni]|uniref:hypothetical protein n=1 Tax=Fulvivirga ligni TaxID=2904246 RepID=UPI001F3F9C5B|nr:hypothetical protein [Fulvivirga ligni]UII23152.1 hypothetical protein LVD16_07925 [Fulvivirga ligni]
MIKNETLWQEIIDFQIDAPFGNYCFSVRLANENNWTLNFTQLAILEYKKFMYLAATSGEMVSPSEVIDVVWHQHLIFSDSYAQLCKILGKDIKHIPSTHIKGQKEQFDHARKRTRELYEMEFGRQPNAIWKYDDMFEPLGLTLSSMSLSTLSVIAVAIILVLMYPFALLLKPVYLVLGNPQFLIGYIALLALAFMLLWYHTREEVESRISECKDDNFVNNLSPLELVYAKEEQTMDVVHVITDVCLRKGVLVADRYTIDLGEYAPSNVMETTVYEEVKSYEPMIYSSLANLLVLQPNITAVGKVMNYFKEYFNRSKFFLRVFSVNLAVLGFFLLFGIGRLIIGLQNGKPVFFLFYVILLTIIIAIIYLKRIQSIILRKAVVNLYKQPERNTRENDLWDYVLTGIPACSLVIRVTAKRMKSRKWTRKGGGYWGAGCGTGCGSCGSSGCGGGCGGCGGS